MPHPQDHEPPGYRELCEKLQTEKDPVKFRAVVEEINRLLAEHEKRLLGNKPKHQGRAGDADT